MNGLNLAIRFASDDGKVKKSVMIETDETITIEVTTIIGGKFKPTMTRKTIGKGTYAPMDPFDYFVDLLQKESDEMDLEAVVNMNRSQIEAEWSLSGTYVDKNPSYYQAPNDVQGALSVISANPLVGIVDTRNGGLMLSKGCAGVIWSIKDSYMASLSLRDDQRSMVVLSTLLKAIGEEYVTSESGTFVKLADVLRPSELESEFQTMCAAQGFYTIPIKYATKASAIW